MPLYYLKMEGGGDSSQRGILPSMILLIGALVIFLSGVIQSLGILGAVEERLEHLLPYHVVHTTPPTILLSIDGEGNGFGALDIGLALRGLGKLRADKVLINGVVVPGSDALSMLTELVKDLENTGISVVAPRPPSLESEFRSIALLLYDPPPSWGLARRWPVLPLKVSMNASYDAGFFLPTKEENGLPLLATDRLGQIVGSIWWAGLPLSSRGDPPWILFGRMLLLPNQAIVWLNAFGEFDPEHFKSTSNCSEFPLDNFLLQLEQKERGTISPGFDSMWDHSTVVIGRHCDISKVLMLDALLNLAHLRRPTLGAQTGITLGWIFLFLNLAKLRWGRRAAASIFFLMAWISLSLVFLHQGMIIPFLPGVLAILILLSPFQLGKS